MTTALHGALCLATVANGPFTVPAWTSCIIVGQSESEREGQEERRRKDRGRKKKKETTDGRTEDFAQTVCDIATRLSWEE